MKAAVILFPGSNRERDAVRALRLVCGCEPQVVWHADTELPAGTDLVVLPGGFSYGDYLRCGAIAGRAPIMDAVRRHAERGGLVLGICNGFQVLAEAHLVPGALLRNASLRFEHRWVTVSVERSDTPFTRGIAAGRMLRLPIAHGEGNYFLPEPDLDRLEARGGVLFRYAPPVGNPNGSARDIAGVIDERGTVAGLMPHPERAVGSILGSEDGMLLFRSLVESAAAGVAVPA